MARINLWLPERSNGHAVRLSEQGYAGALEHELRDRGHEIVRELVIEIDDQGRYVARQRLDEVGLLLHFGPSPYCKRYIDYPKKTR